MSALVQNIFGGSSSPVGHGSGSFRVYRPPLLRCITPTSTSPVTVGSAPIAVAREGGSPQLQQVVQGFREAILDTTSDMAIPVTIGGDIHFVKLVKEVGKGIFSRVYSVQSLFDRTKFYALKTCVDDTHAAKLLRNEFKTLKGLPDSTHTQEKPLSFVEFALNGVSYVAILSKLYESNLHQAIKTYDFERAQKEQIAWQMIQILQHILEKQIYHLDIHLENFLFEWVKGAPKVVLSDFGGLVCLEGEFSDFVFPKYPHLYTEFEWVLDAILNKPDIVKLAIAKLQIRLMGTALVHLFLGSSIPPPHLDDELSKKNVSTPLRQLIQRMVEPDGDQRITYKEIVDCLMPAVV